ncbi:Putative odorant-binding protein A10 [Trachymyrmex cornetzi]|uniref:Putative odorant-binding protein A10 n=1 Tax=Trachymyrmex cornetzi TaxID=471704 RepID=A0A195EDP1_9HYME|nr:Putative odorant-binding protein A10 [Trachymyrmex cornetzi]
MPRLSIALIVTIINVLMCVAEEKLYSDEFDNIDIQTVFNNKGLIEDYYNCFMEIGPCKTPQQRFFTGIFSEAFQTKCKKCTEKQKIIIEKALTKKNNNKHIITMRKLILYNLCTEKKMLLIQLNISSVITVESMSQLSRIILIVAMNVLMYVLAVERYSDQFDDIDMDAILRNDTQREEYHKCYMNTGPCNTMQEALTGTYVYNATNYTDA